jgi:hypothetical protein
MAVRRWNMKWRDTTYVYLYVQVLALYNRLYPIAGNEQRQNTWQGSHYNREYPFL